MVSVCAATPPATPTIKQNKEIEAKVFCKRPRMFCTEFIENLLPVNDAGKMRID